MSRSALRPRIWVIGIVVSLFMGGLYSPGVIRPQDRTKPSISDYIGTWLWMFKGKPFATMVLVQRDNEISGSLTHGVVAMDNEGRIVHAISTDGVSKIEGASVYNGALHVIEKDGNGELEYSMRLTSPTTGELKMYGASAPPVAEPIEIQKAK